MSNIGLLSSLQDDLHKAKQGLKNIDDNIKRVTGRDPNENRNAKRPHKTEEEHNKSRITIPDGIKLITTNFDDEPNIKKSRDEPFGLVSQVSHTKKSRQDLHSSLNDSDKARGRRMFGLLQGTLNAAKKENENKSLSMQEEKRKEIDERLEKEHKIEHEKFQKEKAELFDSRKKQRIEMFILEDRLARTKEFEEWKSDSLQMLGYISTKCTPKIFYKPLSDNEESKKRVLQTEKEIRELIEARSEKLEKELQESERRRRSRLNGSNQETKEDKEPDRKIKEEEQENCEEDDDIDALLMPSTGLLLSQISAVHKEEDESSEEAPGLNEEEEGEVSSSRRIVRRKDIKIDQDTRRINIA